MVTEASNNPGASGRPTVATLAAERVLMMPLKALLAALIVMCHVGTAAAAYLELGAIELTGSFALNSAFDFDHQTARPFGTFSVMTITQATGVLALFVTVGGTMTKNTASMLLQPSEHPMVWSINGYNIETTLAIISGPSFLGHKVSGHFIVTNTGVDSSSLGGPGAFGGSFGFWEFTAPAFNISSGIPALSAPITLRLVIAIDDGTVPSCWAC
jgi:hypothetical protein